MQPLICPVAQQVFRMGREFRPQRELIIMRFTCFQHRSLIPPSSPGSSLLECLKLRVCLVLAGSTGGRNATWAAAEDLRTRVTQSRHVEHTLLGASRQKCCLEGGYVSIVYQKELKNIDRKNTPKPTLKAYTQPTPKIKTGGSQKRLHGQCQNALSRLGSAHWCVPT